MEEYKGNNMGVELYAIKWLDLIFESM